MTELPNIVFYILAFLASIGAYHFGIFFMEMAFKIANVNTKDYTKKKS